MPTRSKVAKKPAQAQKRRAGGRKDATTEKAAASNAARTRRAAVRAQTPRVRSQPLIAVRDVEAASRWYRKLLGCESGHGGSTYERLVQGGVLLLQLHQWDEEDHANLVGADAAPHGHGVLLWFEVDDFDAAVGGARALAAEVVEDVHVNPNARHRELWLRDLDGYVVVIASPEGEAGP
jgi:catechol 2,3-dioxygenase-like lactoylglutathione lyase family enzyme